MKIILTFFYLNLIIMQFARAQTSKIMRADKLYEEGAYFDAIPLYESVLQKGKNQEAIKKLADCYRLTKKTGLAEKLYGEIVKMKSSKALYKLYYAQMLQSNGKCLEAKKWYTAYFAIDKTDNRALQLASSCDSLRFYRADSSNFKVRKLQQINSSQSDFAPILFEKGLVFTSSRFSENGKNKIAGRDGSPYLNMYYSELDRQQQFTTVKSFHGTLDSKLHDGPASFSADFKTIYFTRNVKKKGPVRLYLFTASLENNEWINIEPLPFNKNSFSVGHPSISADGNTLYCTSDKAGQGGTDIFVATKKGSSWGPLKNLGPMLNTRGNEMFPYITGDGQLYFASDGHAGLGGLDIFKATFDEKGNCTSVLNMGAPVNSSYDDFALCQGPQKYTGYFSSNRPGGVGSDDIYQFQDLTEVEIVKFNIEGSIVKSDKKGDNETPIQGAEITLIDDAGKEVSSKTTKEDGKFSFDVESEKEYTMIVEKENHFTKRQKFSTVGKSNTRSVPNENGRVNIKMEDSVKVNVKEIVLNEENIIPNIYYDYNKSDIREDAARELDKVVELMQDNPKIVIEIGSHTDNRGNDNFNLLLSEKRAAGVRDYFIAKGVPGDRITSRGYGKLRPIVPDPLTEEEHSKNRRTEFTVMQVRQ